MVKQFFTKTRWLVTILLITLGIGQMWGATLTYTHDFTTTFSAGDVTLSTITWTASSLSEVGGYNSANYKGVQIGTSKKTGAATLTSKYNWGAQSSTSYYGYTKVKKVYVWMNAGANGTVSATVTIGGKSATSDGTTVAKNSSATSQRNGTTKVTFTPAADGNTGTIVITVTKGTASAAAGYLCSIQVECEEPASCSNAPTVTAGSLKGSVSSSSSATAQCTSGVSNLGGAGCSMTSYGFAVGTSSNPTIGGTLTGTGKTYEVGSSIAVSTGFEKEITGLSASTTYYARPYATNGAGTGYGTQFSFTTLAPCTTAPTVTAGSAGTITSTTAAVSCASGITSLGTGGCTITSYGFVYGTSSNPTTSNSTQQVGTSYTSTGVSFNTSLTGLTEGQLYYVRPYATNGYGTGYGTQTSFGTPKITPSGSSLAFGSKTVGTDDNELTFTVSGTYLQSDISIAKTGTNAAMFSIDKTTVTQTDGTAASTTITVTYAPSAAGSHSATLTLTSTNAANKTVTLSGTGVYVDTFIDALQNTSGYTEASPHTESSTYSTPTLTDKSATTSGTCEEQHWHFMGWITKAKYDAGTTIADGDLQTPTTASNATYYAVWAKGSAGSSGSFELSKSDFGNSYSAAETTLTKLSTNDIGYIHSRQNQTNNTPTGWCANGLIEVRGSSTNHGQIYNKTEISGLNKLRIYEVSGASNLTVYYGTSSKSTANSVSSPFASATGTESVSYSKYSGSCSTSSITLNYYDITIPSGNNFFYLYNGSTVANIFKIVVYYSTYTYSDYKANCCANLITLAAPTITGSGCLITFDKSSPVETCSAAQDVTASVSVTNGYKVTALSFALSTGTYTIDTDPATVLPLTASQDFTLTFAQNHAAATLTTTATVVALQDKYYDYMHDNALKHTKSGNYGTAPTLDSKSVATEAGCMDNHYKFIGWVISTDVNDDGSLKGGYTLIPGGATGKYATGATYIAVWAEEE